MEFSRDFNDLSRHFVGRVSSLPVAFTEGSRIGAFRGKSIMAIAIKCPNGHLLKVKDELAGKSGLCPHCKSRVFVPMPVHTTEKAKISDDEILGLLGPPRQVKAEPPPPPPPPPDSMSDSVHDAPKQESGISLLGSSLLRKQKVCPRCAASTSIAFTHCPRCGTPLPDVGAEKK
jgi:ribosomal protein S27AE